MKTGLLDPDYRQRLLSMRFGTTVLLIAGNAWVMRQYLEFRNTLGEVLPMVSTGPSDLPFVTGIAEHWGVWPVVVASAGVLAAIIYIWGFAQRVLPVVLAAVWAASLCTLVGGLMHIATEEAWK